MYFRLYLILNISFGFVFLGIPTFGQSSVELAKTSRDHTVVVIVNLDSLNEDTSTFVKDQFLKMGLAPSRIVTTKLEKAGDFLRTIEIARERIAEAGAKKVYFFFNSHGSIAAQATKDFDAGDYLLQTTESIDSTVQVVTGKQLVHFLQSTLQPQTKAVLVLDTCHAGGIGPCGGVFQHVFTSSRSDEVAKVATSHGKDGTKQSYSFSNFFVAALSGHFYDNTEIEADLDGDRIVTDLEAFQFAKFQYEHQLVGWEQDFLLPFGLIPISDPRPLYVEHGHPQRFSADICSLSSCLPSIRNTDAMIKKGWIDDFTHIRNRLLFRGDIDGDGMVTWNDTKAALRIQWQYEVPTVAAAISLDMNEDGVLDYKDIGIMQSIEGAQAKQITFQGVDSIDFILKQPVDVASTAGTVGGEKIPRIVRRSDEEFGSYRGTLAYQTGALERFMNNSKKLDWNQAHNIRHAQDILESYILLLHNAAHVPREHQPKPSDMTKSAETANKFLDFLAKIQRDQFAPAKSSFAFAIATTVGALPLIIRATSHTRRSP